MSLGGDLQGKTSKREVFCLRNSKTWERAGDGGVGDRGEDGAPPCEPQKIFKSIS